MIRPILTLVFALPLALCAQIARADVVRAVLVGVGDYLVLDADLKGPPADAVLMAQTLMARGVAAGDITVLTTGDVPDGVVRGAPEKAPIMAALAAVAGKSASGDTVVFYFSGHGAQAPDLNGDEGGGYDEILLPADASGWKGAIGSVENALIDDELADWARPLLARGVKVVGIVDACHSATGFRALGGAGVARWVPPEALGLTDDMAGDDTVDGASDPLEGDFVFLYSSQSDQRSFEYPLGDGAVWHGEFTLRLADVLTHAPDASWRQVLAATSDSMAQGPARQQPDAEGPLLGAPVFGTGRVQGRYGVDGVAVKAGFLDGLTDGATMALFGAAAGGQALGAATISGVTARSATLSTTAQGANWAEVSAPAPPPELRVGAAVIRDSGAYAAWLSALPDPVAGPADLVPVLIDGGLVLAGGDGVLDPAGPGSSPRVMLQTGETEANAVARVLGDAAYALRLRAALAGGGGKARTLTARPVLQTEVTRRAALGGCDHVGDAVPFAGVAAPCDQLWLQVKNTSGKDQDVTILYLDKAFKISALWPNRGLSNRIAAGEGFRAGLQIEPGSTAGLEEIWLIAVPADPTGPRADLSDLASGAATRASRASGTANWLLGQMDGEVTTRGFAMTPPPFVLIRQVVRIVPTLAARD